MATLVKYSNYELDIENLKVKTPDGKTISVDDIPYKDHNVAEVLYTANYIYEQYTDRYDLTEEQCVEVADAARQYMNDYDVSEDDGIDYALEQCGYEEKEEDEDDEKPEYNAEHAQEWMEKHPHGWYNNENDYGEDAEEDR